MKTTHFPNPDIFTLLKSQVLLDISKIQVVPLHLISVTVIQENTSHLIHLEPFRLVPDLCAVPAAVQPIQNLS